MKYSIIILFISFFACKADKTESPEIENKPTSSEMAFDQVKWKVKEGSKYPYRDKMLNDIVFNDTIRALKKDELINLLGEPERINEGHLYYRITQNRIGLWPLSTKTMVIKLSEDNSVEWIKIHE